MTLALFLSLLAHANSHIHVEPNTALQTDKSNNWYKHSFFYGISSPAWFIAVTKPCFATAPKTSSFQFLHSIHNEKHAPLSFSFQHDQKVPKYIFKKTVNEKPYNLITNSYAYLQRLSGRSLLQGQRVQFPLLQYKQLLLRKTVRYGLSTGKRYNSLAKS